MLNHETDLIQCLAKIQPAGYVCLILPFTPSLLLDPTPLLSTIYQTVVALPATRIVVYFATPPADTMSHPEQLYDTLRRNPRANWDAFQRFLAEVYATLSAGQWACDKVLLSVEVRFSQMIEALEQQLWRETDVILHLEGHEALLPSNLPPYLPIHSIPSPSFPSSCSPTYFSPPGPSPGPDVVALGGTFDHLHAAHKLLLHLAHFLAQQKVIVGVITDSLLDSKTHKELIQPTSGRMANVEKFMFDLSTGESPSLELDIVEIFDAFGPTRNDPDIQALVISDETRSGGQAVNDLRKEKGLGELEIWCIGVISAGSSTGSASDGGRGKRAGSPGREVYGSGSSTGSGILKGLDEKTLKEVKMGSTAVRKWLAEERDRGEGRRRAEGVSGEKWTFC